MKPAKPMIAAEEDRHLQEAEQALLQLLNDNIEEADKALKGGHSSYHHLGRGISGFIAAMLYVFLTSDCRPIFPEAITSKSHSKQFSQRIQRLRR